MTDTTQIILAVIAVITTIGTALVGAPTLAVITAYLVTRKKAVGDERIVYTKMMQDYIDRLEKKIVSLEYRLQELDVQTDRLILQNSMLLAQTDTLILKNGSLALEVTCLEEIICSLRQAALDSIEERKER